MLYIKRKQDEEEIWNYDKMLIPSTGERIFHLVVALQEKRAWLWCERIEHFLL